MAGAAGLAPGGAGGTPGSTGDDAEAGDAGEADDACRAPPLGDVGAGGGACTIVASRSFRDSLPVSLARCAASVEAGDAADAGVDDDRGTPGNAPPRAGVRGSDATGGGGSEDDAGGAAVVRSERRGAGPCQSQIERPGSGACAAPALDPVANAG